MADAILARMRAHEQRLDAKALREILDYDPKTGAFTRRLHGRRRSKRGGVGYLTTNGYVSIRVDGFGKFQAHRLAWLHFYGRWPEGRLDHEDCNRSNNCIDNLREASRSQNQWNMGKQCRNTSGYKGVYWDKSRSKWTAQIGIRGRYNYLGRFDTAEEAAEAYAESAKRLHGEFARID